MIKFINFVCWFKFNYGLDYQRAQNIYGGGFSAQTSFVISWGGTSASHGVLRYPETGTDHNYNRTADYGGNDGNWHMFASTDTGGDGAQSTTVYIDGVSQGTTTSNASYDTPDTATRLTWGSWNVTYGNMGGKTNCYMYYERVLSASEILQIYNQMKGRFQWEKIQIFIVQLVTYLQNTRESVQILIVRTMVNNGIFTQS